MKIAQILPGSGGAFYCENCARDSLVVQALRARGHDPVLIPLYLPLFSDGADLTGGAPLFFGGVNAWLQQHVSLFRGTPRWVDRLLDSPRVLAWAARRAGSTRASALGPMTLSMLRGEAGRQAKELERLSAWLEGERPDVIHLSNALLLGLARRLRQRTGAAVVCSLQDEAPWVDAMGDPWAARCWEALAERAADADAFAAVSRSYADVMAARLPGITDRLCVVPIGLDAEAALEAPLDFEPPVLGYLGRLSASCGLGVLAEAFGRLRRDPRHRTLRLRATGGLTGDDAGFVTAVRAGLSAQGLADAAEFGEAFDRRARGAFLATLSLFSAPGVEQTAFGLAVLEAQAAGVPAVQPRRGAYVELLEDTGGGVLYEPGPDASSHATALAEALDGLLSDPARARAVGRQGRAAVRERYGLEGMADRTLAVYAAALARRVRR